MAPCIKCHHLTLKLCANKKCKHCREISAANSFKGYRWSQYAKPAFLSWWIDDFFTFPYQEWITFEVVCLMSDIFHSGIALNSGYVVNLLKLHFKCIVFNRFCFHVQHIFYMTTLGIWWYNFPNLNFWKYKADSLRFLIRVFWCLNIM